MEPIDFIHDDKQREVIGFKGGIALVLAAPGCGKTDVLSYRIIKAHRDYGVPYGSMLCLTFTNRASREMQERVKQNISGSVSDLFIGNLHRFCMRFLTENNLLNLDTSVIDEDDQAEIIGDLAGQEDFYRNYGWFAAKVTGIANRLNKKLLGFPKHLVDFAEKRPRKEESRLHELAEAYIRFKRENRLIDYDDIINLAYSAMLRPDFKTLAMSDYSWIQIDEIQDLNPLQMAIIDRLANPISHTILYLGDERQAIFSFIGASLSGLQSLKKSVKVFNFGTNYRCPKYLLDFINRYAVANFGVTQEELPKASNDLPNDRGLVLFKTQDGGGYEQASLIAAETRQLNWFRKGETIGILARSNYEVDRIAECLDRHHLDYLKLSRRDMFKKVDFKTLYSHLAVVANEHRGAEWSRILYQTKAVEKMGTARQFVSQFRKSALSMTDMLRNDDSSYLTEFRDVLQNEVLVVFDTETTGLDIFSDDVIQIAAVKMDAGGIIPGSEFEVLIETARPIPQRLGNGALNPMSEIYSQGEKQDFGTAFSAFLDYIGDSPLAGHNVGFDSGILRNNARRRLPSESNHRGLTPRCYDTLKLARLLDPDLRSHSLGSLLKRYGLDGVNSHNAIDDAIATSNLILHLKEKICNIMPIHQEILQSRGVARLRRRLRANYGSYYAHTMAKLHDSRISEENSLLSELRWLHDNLAMDKIITALPKFDYILELFEKVMVDKDSEPRFAEQLLNHVYEMRTFSESDLYSNGMVKESIHLMTIHKAKGLQFDNVFVFGTEKFPSHIDVPEDGSLDESKRILYVAISRAKKRLYLCCNKRLSRFIDMDMLAGFEKPAQQQLDKIMRLEDLYSDALKAEQ